MIEPRELLKSIVEIQSFSKEEHELSEFLVRTMNGMGFETSIDDVGNVVATRGEGKHVLLTAHMDTIQPFLPVRVEGDILHGRGSVDCKASLAALIVAASSVQGLRVTVVGMVDEEGGNAGARFLAHQTEPDLCIVGEPANWNSITVGYRGWFGFNYSLRRGQIHSSNADSVAFDVMKFISRISSLSTGKGFNNASLEVRSLQCNNSEAEMHCVLRIPLDFDFVSAKKLILENADDAEITFGHEDNAVIFPKNNALVRAFIHSIREYDGTPIFKKKTGFSDVNILAQSWNCPFVVYGPGDSHLDHTPQEHIDLKEFEKSIRVLSSVLEKLR